MSETLPPLDETTCSRIADPEGKHLEICRIQLARTVKQRDELAAMIERFAEDIDGQGDEIWAKQLRLHVREIYSENAIAVAPPTQDSNEETK